MSSTPRAGQEPETPFDPIRAARLSPGGMGRLAPKVAAEGEERRRGRFGSQFVKFLVGGVPTLQGRSTTGRRAQQPRDILFGDAPIAGSPAPAPDPVRWVAAGTAFVREFLDTAGRVQRAVAGVGRAASVLPVGRSHRRDGGAMPQWMELRSVKDVVAADGPSAADRRSVISQQVAASPEYARTTVVLDGLLSRLDEDVARPAGWGKADIAAREVWINESGVSGVARPASTERHVQSRRDGLAEDLANLADRLGRVLGSPKLADRVVDGVVGLNPRRVQPLAGARLQRVEDGVRAFHEVIDAAEARSGALRPTRPQVRAFVACQEHLTGSPTLGELVEPGTILQQATLAPLMAAVDRAVKSAARGAEASVAG